MRLFIFLLVILAFAGCNKIIETTVRSNTERQQANDSVVKEKENQDFVCRYPVEPDISNRIEWVKYLQDNLTLDSASLDTILPGKYTVMIAFVVNRDGQISDVTIEKDPGYGLGKRAKDVIMLYKNSRFPLGMVMEAYRSYRKQPVTFVIEDDETTDEDCNEPAL